VSQLRLHSWPVLTAFTLFVLTLWSCGDLGDDSMGFAGYGGSAAGRAGEAAQEAGRGGRAGSGGDGGTTSACEAELPRLVITWKALQTTGGPSARSLHAATAIPNGLLLLGGTGQATELADSWSLSGTEWQLLDSGPPGRAAHAMVSTSDSAFLFGGSGIEGLLGDTWVWQDGWRDRCPDGACPVSPSARASHRMAFNPETNKVVLFGGSDGLPLGDGWEWNDASGWQQTCGQRTDRALGDAGAAGADAGACAPSARNEHALAYDPETKRVLMFGGHDGRTELGDLWAFERSAWTELREATGNVPAAVAGHVMAYDPEAHVLLLVGGTRNDVAVSASYGLLTGSMTWLEARELGDIPSQRAHGSLTYDAAGQRMVFYDQGSWTLSSQLISTADYCGCLASCEAVCPNSGSLCRNRCETGVSEAPSASECPNQGDAGASGMGGAGGVGEAGGTSLDPAPSSPECQTLWTCCAELDDPHGCKRTAAADDPKICVEVQPLCGALQGGTGAEGAECLELGACCARLKGSLGNTCFTILSGSDADCAEFFAGGYCEAN
jgi:hypothetical protein